MNKINQILIFCNIVILLVGSLVAIENTWNNFMVSDNRYTLGEFQYSRTPEEQKILIVNTHPNSDHTEETAVFVKSREDLQYFPSKIGGKPTEPVLSGKGKIEAFMAKVQNKVLFMVNRGEKVKTTGVETFFEFSFDGNLPQGVNMYEMQILYEGTQIATTYDDGSKEISAPKKSPCLDFPENLLNTDPNRPMSLQIIEDGKSWLFNDFPSINAPFESDLVGTVKTNKVLTIELAYIKLDEKRYQPNPAYVEVLKGFSEAMKNGKCEWETKITKEGTPQPNANARKVILKDIYGNFGTVFMFINDNNKVVYNVAYAGWMVNYFLAK